MEEFGCTADSIVYYPVSDATLIHPNHGDEDVYYPVGWLLDLITNPQGSQVHITYQRDMAAASDGLTYPRNSVPATIEWDSPNCVNAKQRCTGSAWQPHYRVQFVASHSVARLTNSPSNCNTSANTRCDDPANVSGGIKAPLVNNTFVLNDANVQVNTSDANGGTYSSSTWNTVRDYQFSYEQSGPAPITDPVTGKQLSAAGYLDLTKFQEVGDGNGNGDASYPPLSFTYTSKTEYYEDSNFTPYSTSACGPSWNTGSGGTAACDLWSQTYDGNSRYLASVSNGQGLAQTFTWDNARSNTHGTGSSNGTDIANPFYCNTHQSGYPCNSADDHAWSRIVLTQRGDTVQQVMQAGQGGTKTTTDITSTHAYSYRLPYPLAAQECADCVAGFYWGDQNDGDYLDYYNAHFMGFAQATVSNPDGSVEVHKFETTLGWGVYDTSAVTDCRGVTCHASPWWNVANVGHGLETEADYYDTDGTTLLKKTTTSYNAICPPSGLSATPAYTVGSNTYGPWDGMRVSAIDHTNPVATCDVQLHDQTTFTYDGTGASIWATDTYTYDTYGRQTQDAKTTSSSDGAGPTTIYYKTNYVMRNELTLPPAQRNDTDQSPSSANSSWWSGVYFQGLVALQTVEDSSGTRYSCVYTAYDGLAYTTGAASGLTQGNVTEQDTYTNCGTAPDFTPSGKISSTATYDGFGNQTAARDPDANAGDASHTIAAGTAACVGNTSCTAYEGTTQAKTTASTNVAGQTSNNAYDVTAAGGFGLWPTSVTDANGQKTTMTYDALGRMLTMRAPGQSTGPATQETDYANWCATTGAATPCVEVDTVTRVDATHSVRTRQFYDGLNRLVETRSAAPGGQDVVTYTRYNAAGETIATSVSYFVPAYTGAAGSSAFSIPDSTQSMTTMAYDGLGRLVHAADALSNSATISYHIVCGAPGTDEGSACYEQTLAVDPDGHQQGALADGFGRSVYAQRYSGTGGSYTLYSTSKTTYDYLGRAVQVRQPGGTSTSTTTYDAAGHVLSTSDPDRGLLSYVYDSNGNVTQQKDARNVSTYTGYDGLNRPIWRNSSTGGGNTPSGAYVTYSYDGNPSGNGAGRLTAEVFKSGSLSGAYTYTYDAQGRTIRTDQTMGGAGVCPTGWTCQDIGSPAHAGTQSYAGDGIWTVQGGGSDIYGTSDQFHYVYQSLSGDGMLSAQVAALNNTDVYAKATVMVRANNDNANAPFYTVEVTSAYGVEVVYRDAAGNGAATLLDLPDADHVAPIYIAVARVGTTYTGYTSHDGINWTLIPGSSRTMSNLGGTVRVGLAVNPRNTATVTTGTFASVNLTTGGANQCPAATGWTCQDIGSPTPAGTQSDLGNGVWTVAGSGSDIWGTSDQFHYVSQPLSGDGSFSAHVDAQGNTNAWAKAGVMLRGSSAANAPYYAVYLTPGNGISVQVRTTVGGSAAIQASTSGTVPTYLKVTRSGGSGGSGGTTYTAYTSADGATWTAITGSSITIPALSGTVLEGLAVTSHSAGTLSTVTFDQLSPSVPSPSGLLIASPSAPSSVVSYPMQTSYNDASLPTQLTYSDGEHANYSYDSASGWLAGLTTTPAGGSTTTLLSSLGYTGAGGAAGHATSASVGGGTYTYTAAYDTDVRLTTLALSNASTNTILFRSLPGYDAASNVTGVSTTLANGTDNQQFCYDAQNRLVWAGAMGTVPCTNQVMTSGTLTTAEYTNTYAYDTLDRLTSGQVGDYTYGESAHLHAVTSIGVGGTTNYSASYDALGDMTCRAPTNATTCAGGSPTGNVLTYDNEGRLATWQSTPSSPTTTASYLYDGEGNRVEQQVTTSGTTTSTAYVAGGSEEATTSGGTTTLTKYFSGAAGLPTAERVGTNGPLSYLATDGQGTVSETLDASGNATFQALYGPYGTARYTSGSSPTSLGYTGQRADAATGLDYYQARYYDPVAGQFASADSVADGLNRYGYVGGNPTTATDPSGHMACSSDFTVCSSKLGKKEVEKNNTDDDGHHNTNPGPKTGKCRNPTVSDYQWCYDTWHDINEPLRDSALRGEWVAANALIAAGYIVVALADLVLFMAEKSAIHSLILIGDIALNVVTGLYYLGVGLANAQDTALQATITYMSGFAQFLGGALRGIMAAYAAWGPVGEAAGDAAVIALKGALGGLPSVLTTIILTLAGAVVNNLLSAGGHMLIALGSFFLTGYQLDAGEPLESWCAQNKGVCGDPPPSPYAH